MANGGIMKNYLNFRKAALFCIFLCHWPFVHAIDYTWTGSASTNYIDAGNWTPAGGPPLTTDTAIFDSSPPMVYVPSITGTGSAATGTISIAPDQSLNFSKNGLTSTWNIGSVISTGTASSPTNAAFSISSPLRIINAAGIGYGNFSYDLSNYGTFYINNTATGESGNASVHISSSAPASQPAQLLTYTSFTVSDINMLTSDAITLGGIVTLSNQTGVNSNIGATIFDTTGLQGGFNISAGSLTLAPPRSNTFSGGITVNSGASLIAANGSALGTGPIVFQGGTFAPSASLTVSQTCTVSQNATFDVLAGNTLTVNTLNGTDGVTLAGSGGGQSAIRTVNVSSGTFTISANLGGSNSLALNGPGTLVLSNASNSYSGGTLLNSGVLSIASAGNIGGAGTSLTFAGGGLEITSNLALSGQMFINTNASIATGASILDCTGATVVGTNGTTLSSTGNGLSAIGTVNVPTGTFTISAPLEGSGSLTLTGAGALILSNTSNTYSGGTILSGGTLLVANAGNIGGSSSSLTFAGGNLEITSNIALTGPGLISAQASGAISSNPANTYAFDGSTATLVGSDGAVLQAATNCTFSAIQVPSGTFTLTGNLQGSSMTKTGAGNLVIPGNVPWSVSVSDGIFTLNGSLTQGVEVSSGATFAGTGAVGQNVTVYAGGKIAPGNSPGTLSVAGNFTTNGIFQVEITPQGAASLLDLSSGTATLGGSLFVIADPGEYIVGTDYTILSAANIAGTFSSTNLKGLIPGITASLVYSPTALLIHLSPGSFSPEQLASLSGNNYSLASYINTVNIALLEDSFQLLAGLNGTELSQALETLSPSRSSFATYAIETSLLSCSNILNTRMTAQRPSLFPTHQSAFAADSLQAAEGEDVLTPPTSARKRNRSIWALGFGDFATNAPQHQNPRFDLTTAGAMLGGDFGTSSQESAHTFGAAIAYTYSKVHDHKHFGRADISSAYLCLYGTRYWSDWFMDAALWGGYAHVNQTRNIFFSTYSAQAQSNRNCYTGDAHIAVGYDFSWTTSERRTMIEPFIAIDWALDLEPSFSEHGASPYNMHLKRHFSSLLQTEVGCNGYWVWNVSWGEIWMKDKLSYMSRVPLRTGALSANLVGFPGAFSVTSFTRNLNLFSPSIELNFKRHSGLYTLLSYDGQFGSGWMLNEVVIRVGKVF